MAPGSMEAPLVNGLTLEANWRAYKASLTPAERKAIETHLANGGQVAIQLTFT